VITKPLSVREPGKPAKAAVRETPFWRRFVLKMIVFVKTGSGQT
jgi:hypothetical protein